MISKLELSDLFETKTRNQGAELAELVAVRDRCKGISMTTVSSTQDPKYREFQSQARTLGLQVEERVRQYDDGVTELFLFAFHDDQRWRIEAYFLSCDALFSHYKWSDVAEFNHSLILGYSPEQAHDWLAAHRHRRVGWDGPTIYLLATESKRTGIEKLFGRLLPPYPDKGEFLIYPLKSTLALKLDTKYKTDDCVVFRMSVIQECVIDLIGNTYEDSPMTVIENTEVTTDLINRNLTSNIELWNGTGWEVVGGHASCLP